MKQLFLNKALRILNITNGMILISVAMLGPIYALFVEKIGGDLMDASIAGSIFALVAGIVTYGSGNYSDKLKHSEMLVVIGYAIMGMGFFAYIWAANVYAIFFIQAIIGLGEAIYSPPFDALYSKHINKGKSGSQWAAWESMNYFTAAIGAIIGGGLVTMFSFEVLFFIMGLLCFSSALYIFLLDRNIL